MMRSLYSAVSGLRVHQTRMDVIGNNIANVNTPGYKRSRANFQDLFYQTLRGGSEPTADRGGTNPQQVGLGLALGSIDVLHTQGASAPTGSGSDVMIQGDGFFVLTDNAGNLFYTRAGNFSFDAEGYLVNPASGYYVTGPDGLIQLANPEEVQSYNIDTFGNVKYIDGSGTPQTAGRIGVAKFINPGGMEQAGGNLYRWAEAAGAEVNGEDEGGIPGEFGRGTLIPGALEMSNVELASEFSDMIVTQRGFQANARVISVSDQMLEELANLKR